MRRGGGGGGVGPAGPTGPTGATGATGPAGTLAFTTGALAADTSVPNNGSTWTDLVTITASGTGFLIVGEAAGLSGGALTPRLRITVDGSVVESSYGPACPSGGSGVAMTALAVATGLSNSSHTIKLQAQASGAGGWTINANSNSSYERAKLVATAAS